MESARLKSFLVYYPREVRKHALTSRSRKRSARANSRDKLSAKPRQKRKKERKKKKKRRGKDDFNAARARAPKSRDGNGARLARRPGVAAERYFIRVQNSSENNKYTSYLSGGAISIRARHTALSMDACKLHSSVDRGDATILANGIVHSARTRR